jgi:hypothetical protein
MSTISLKKRWKDLLQATLEAWAHQILFQRHVYPQASFAPTRFFGVQCQANRHPDVVSYISESIALAAEYLASDGADQISLLITDEDSGGERELERYTLELFVAPILEWEDEATDINMERLERAMRDLILKVLGLESHPVSPTDTRSFRITVHISEGQAARREDSFLNREKDGGSFTLDIEQSPVSTTSDRFLWDDFHSGLYNLRFGSMLGSSDAAA